jgi:hypothetical protein
MLLNFNLLTDKINGTITTLYVFFCNNFQSICLLIVFNSISLKIAIKMLLIYHHLLQYNKNKEELHLNQGKSVIIKELCNFVL